MSRLGPSKGTSSTAASAVRLTRLYIAALSAVALLTLAGQVLVQFSLSTQVADARVVNLAGRQRMLSQKITKSILAMQQARDAATRTAFREEVETALPLFVRSHHALQFGDRELGLPGNNSAPIAAMFSKLEPQFQTIATLAQNVLVLTDPASATTTTPAAVDLQKYSEPLLATEQLFLASMDTIVFEFDREAEARVERLRLIETLLFVTTLLVLLLEGWLVFRPAVAQIEQHTSDLVKSQHELQQAKEVAENANREKDLLLANVSHELRNPLHAILGYSDLVLRDLPSSVAREHLAIIRDAAETQLRLVNDLLDISQLTSSTLRLQLEPVDPHSIIRRCLSITAPLATQKNIQLRLIPHTQKGQSLAENAPTYVEADPLRLLQVLWNLVTNAIKFSEHGEVTVHTCTDWEHSRFTITVRDRGPGIGLAEQTKIFDPFYQIDTSLERKHGGIGLGLAICKFLVEGMGGSIRLESELSQGSEFTIELRTTSPPETQAAQDTAKQATLVNESAHPQPLQLLVVDDDPINLKLLDAWLTPLGHKVLCASSVAGAFELFAQHGSIDACLIDIQMPSVSGTAFAQQLRAMLLAQKTSVPRLIAVSATAKPASTEDLPFDDWLEKPIALLDLLHALPSNSLMHTARQRTASQASERWNAALDRLSGNHELLQLLASDFLGGIPRISADLRTAVNEGNLTEQRRIVHLLRGQVSVFQATQLAEELLRYETVDHASATPPAINLPRLEMLTSELCAELRQLLASPLHSS